MGMPSFRPDSEVIPNLPPGSDQALLHAPTTVSTTPIIVGVVVLSLGLWFLSAALHTPFVVPSRAPGAEANAVGEPQLIPFPEGLEGTIDVFAKGPADAGGFASVKIDETDEARQFVVVDADRREVEPVVYPTLRDVEGRGDEAYALAEAVEVGPHDRFELRVSDWSGPVAFVPDDHPPTDPNWKSIIEALAVVVAGAILALVWGIRRLRWKSQMKRHREALAAAGGVVD